jgi:hypothetical protein
MVRDPEQLFKIFRFLLFQAFDGDAEAPNNEVHYEIVAGNRNEMFHIDAHTGTHN